MLKSNIDQLPDDAEVAESNIIARYAQRPHTLENVCLAECAAYYDSRTGAEETSRSDDEFEADYSAHSQNTHTTKRRSFARVIRTYKKKVKLATWYSAVYNRFYN